MNSAVLRFDIGLDGDVRSTEDHSSGNYVPMNADILSFLGFVFTLRSILQQLLVSITFPNFLDAGEFPSIVPRKKKSFGLSVRFLHH